MKTKKTLGMALALASALFLAACSNMDSGSVDNGAAFLYSATRTLTVNVNDVELSDGSGNGVYDPWINRTVLPGTAYTTDDLTLVLKAISNGKTVSYQYLAGGTAVASPGTGTQYSVTLTAASYDFWLYAFKTSDVTAAAQTSATAEALMGVSDIEGGTDLTAALWAHGAQDLTNGAASISFTLSPTDLTGKGTVKLAGAYVDTDGTVKAVKIGLYNIYTNDVVGTPVSYTITSPAASTESAPSYFGNAASVTGTITSGVVAVDEANAASFEVPAGSYRAAVTFYQDAAMTTEIGYWSDFVIVEPTNTSKKLDIFFKGIKTIPAAPTALTAYLVEGSFGAGKSTYDIDLEWTDNASNEKGFLVRVKTYTVDFGAGSETAGSTAIYGFSAGTVKGDATQNYTVSALIDSGYFTQTATATTNLLLSQCGKIRLTLKTGYLYDFEVVAYNAIGCSKYSETNATGDGYSATSTDALYWSNYVTSGWTPRKVVAGTSAFASNQMQYKKAANTAAVAAAFTAVDQTSVTAPVKGTDYYTTSDGGTSYNIAYVSSWASGTTYYTLNADTGTPFTPYHVNLYYVRYDLEGGLYYNGSAVNSGSQYAFFRFGNDAATFNQNFGTAGALKGTEALQNPVTATDITTTSKGATATTPFIVKWNSSNTAYSNWNAWYRQSDSVNGTTHDYTSAAGAPIAADPLLLTENNGAYGNQVVYGQYTGAQSALTIIVTINSAASGTYNLQDSAITAQAVASPSATTGSAITITQDATTEVNVSTNPYLYLKIATTSVAYTALRYEINGVVQSSTVNNATGACVVPLNDWVDQGPITVLLAGYYNGAWYSRSFSVKFSSTN
ncbi:MAG: hypothetical protein K5917_05455 [Clostridiales bacterium]|nr:hypothetical protein [Clostridiales bacterium]